MKEKKTKFNLKFFFYWALAISFVAWGWTTLYIHSYGNVWGGKDNTAAKTLVEKRDALIKLAQLEKKPGADQELFDQRVLISLQCSESKDYVAARKVLQEENDALSKLPESELNFNRKVRLEEYVAHTYMDEGLYNEARNSLNRCIALAKQMQDRYFSDDSLLLPIALNNELGVLAYLEASCTLDYKVRNENYDKSQAAYQVVLDQIKALQSNPSKLTAEANQRLLEMKKKTQLNLDQVKEDRDHEGDFEKT